MADTATVGPDIPGPEDPFFVLLEERAQERRWHDELYSAAKDTAKRIRDKARQLAEMLKLDKLGEALLDLRDSIVRELRTFGFGKTALVLVTTRGGRKLIAKTLGLARRMAQGALRLIYRPIGWLIRTTVGEGAAAKVVSKARQVDEWLVTKAARVFLWFERQHDSGWMTLIRRYLDFALIGHLARRFVPAKWRGFFYLGTATVSPLGATTGSAWDELKTAWFELKRAWNEGRDKIRNRKAAPGAGKVVTPEEVTTKFYGRDKRNGRVYELLKTVRRNGGRSWHYADTHKPYQGNPSHLEELTEPSFRTLKTQQDAADALKASQATPGSAPVEPEPSGDAQQ